MNREILINKLTVVVEMMMMPTSWVPQKFNTLGLEKLGTHSLNGTRQC